MLRPYNTLALHLQLEPSLAAFEAFYNQKHNGRKLTWLFNQSRGELMSTYLKSRISFQVRG
jgi:cullin 1